MTTQQRDAILNEIANFEKINNIDDVMQKHYEDKNFIILDNITVIDMVTSIKKIFAQFKMELSTTNYSFLPITFNYDGQNITLLPTIQNLISYTKTKAHHPNHLLPVLNQLISYQLTNGFWNKSEYTYKKDALNKSKEEINWLKKEFENELSAAKTEKDKFVKNFEQQIVLIETEKNKLIEFQKNKQKQLIEIDNAVVTVRNQAQEINTLLNQSTEGKAIITQISETQKTNLNEITEELKKSKLEYERYQKEHSDTKIKIDEIIANFAKEQETIDRNLNDIESNKVELKVTKENIDKLLSEAVGASLFHTFNKRKESLNKPVLYWFIGVIVVFILVLVYILTLLYFFIDSGGSWWEKLSINILRSIPAFIISYFTIHQYNKERNYQEEYAFKSAVALTIEAYSRILTDVNNKDKLIMEAVANIYQNPISKPKTEDIKMQTITDAIKTLKDVVEAFTKKDKSEKEGDKKDE
jgi:hypothetical protein